MYVAFSNLHFAGVIMKILKTTVHNNKKLALGQIKKYVWFLLQLINYLTCSTMFLVPNIDQMYKEMKKIVEVGNKHGNRDEFLDFADLF
jgi:hypothetical protein